MGLVAKQVEKLTDGWHHDGHGLYLVVTNEGAGRSWVYRYYAGRQKYIGLGPTYAVSLAVARDKALQCKQLRLQGIDPLEHRQQQEREAEAKRARTKTFREAAADYLKLHLEGFRDGKHRQQWQNTLATYAAPLNDLIVADITPADILGVIEPHWNDRRETASRVLQRIARVLDYAATRGLRTGDNPAASVTSALPKNGNHKGHFEALPYNELPSFLVELRQRDNIGARALEFCVLTACRSGEARGATWAEFDLENRVWTIPASRMKAGKEHRVPLSDRAVELLRSAQISDPQPFRVSAGAMIKVLAKMGRSGLTVHGFRSTFMDWCHERTRSYPPAVFDMALAHTVSDKVEAAYRRGDMFEHRVRLMAEWDRFCVQPTVSQGVVPLRSAS